MQNLENYNRNMANQMISILNSLNDNITSLAGKLKAKGFLEVNEEKEKVEDRMDEGTTVEITVNHLDQTGQKNQDKMAKEIQKTYEATETMQDLERKVEE